MLAIFLQRRSGVEVRMDMLRKILRQRTRRPLLNGEGDARYDLSANFKSKKPEE